MNMFVKMQRILAALLMLAMLAGSIPVSAEQIMDISVEPMLDFNESFDDIPEEVFMEVEELQPLTPAPSEEPAGEAVVPEDEEAFDEFPAIEMDVSSLSGNDLYGCSVYNGTLTSYNGTGAHFEIPAEVTAIGNGAFSGNAYLESVVIPAGVVSIGDNAFRDCSALKSVSLPEGLLEIRSDVFNGCAKLEGIVLPESLMAMGTNIFNSCAENFCVQVHAGSLAEAYCEAEQLPFKRIGQEEVPPPVEIVETPASSFKYSIKNGKCTITDFKGKETEIVIPALIKDVPVTAIAAEAFLDCKKIVSIHIQPGVTSIGASAFKNCKALERVIVPASVVQISGSAFSGCKNYVLVVDENSWAYNWCIEKNIAYELSGNVLNAPTALSLNETEITLGVGEKLQLQGVDSLGGSDGFTFASSKSSAASVNASGVIAAKKAGKATITVRTANYVKAECKVTVKAAPKSISLSPKKLILYVGQSMPLSWKLTSGAAGKVSFSSNSECASVDENGVITAAAIGEAKITAATYNGKKASCTVQVVDVPSFVSLEESSLELPMCMSAQLKPIIDEGTLTSFSYASDDESIAVVDENGVVTGVNEGTTTLRVSTHNGHSAECTAVITLAPTQIILPEEAISMGLKEKLTLAPIDNLGNTEGFSFASSKSSVAGVDENGTVTAKKAGKAVITIGAFNGVIAKCSITVKSAPKSVSLAPKQFTLYEGQSMPLSWKVNSGAAGKVSFSSNSECVSVDASGVVTALSIGEAKVTASTYNGKKASCTVNVVGVPSFVMLEQESLELPMHMQAQLKPIIDEGALTTYTYTSDDASIASVDENGVVTAIRSGETIVRVTTHNGFSAECKIKVSLAPSAIILPEAISMGVKEKHSLAPVDDLGGRENFSFKSSKPSVASVNAEGMITAKKTGKAIITVGAFNGIEARCTVTVKSAPSAIKLDKKSITLLTGQTYPLSWTLSSKSAGSVSFSSSSDCVSVDENGVISAVSEGTAKITAVTFNGKKASCSVTVKSSKYAITSMRTDAGKVYATVSTKDACTLYAEVLSDDGREVIFSASVPAAELLSMEEIAVASGQALPKYYMLRSVLLNDQGEELCSPFISRRYTQAYRDFENQKPGDYDKERVLDFGDAGYGVLAETVKIIEGQASVNGDDYTFDTDLEIKPGDVLLLNGEPVKVGAVLFGGHGRGGGGGGGNHTGIRRNRNVKAHELYDVIQIDGYVDLGDAYYNGSKAELRHAKNNEAIAEVLKIKKDFEIDDNFIVTPEIGGTVRIRLVYDKEKLGKNYFETEYYVEASGKIDFFVGAAFKKDKTIELVDPFIPIGTTGLNFDMELNIPISFDAKAGGTATYSFAMKKGVAYTPDMGKQEINEEAQPKAEFKLAGEFTASVGISVTGGIAALDDILRIALGGEVGISAKGEWAPVNTADKLNEAKTAMHACQQCVDITVSVYGEFFVSLNSRFNDEGEDSEVFKVTLARGEIPILEFYFSLKSEALGVHKGEMKFGAGDCPNNKYRTTVNTVDEYMNPITDIVLVVSREGMVDIDGLSTLQTYLYPGEYTASGNFDGYFVSRKFIIADRPGGTTLNAPAYSLEGYVTDAYTDAPIAGVSVSIALPDNKTLTVQTDAEGFYNFRNLKAGDCSLLFAASGYPDKRFDGLNFKPNTVNRFDAQMMGAMPILTATVSGPGEAQALPEDGSLPDGIPKITLKNTKNSWNMIIGDAYVYYEGCAEPYKMNGGADHGGSKITCMDMGDGQYTIILDCWVMGTAGGSEIVILQVKNGKLTPVKEFTWENFTDKIYVDGKFSTDTKCSGTMYPTGTKFTANASHPGSSWSRKGKPITGSGTGYLDFQKNDKGYYDIIYTTSNRCGDYNIDVIGTGYTLYSMENGELKLKKQWFKGTADK